MKLEFKKNPENPLRRLILMLLTPYRLGSIVNIEKLYFQIVKARAEVG
ncbi:MAG: hypothetical protein QW797_00660 [Thermoproteota archaeon]